MAKKFRTQYSSVEFESQVSTRLALRHFNKSRVCLALLSAIAGLSYQKAAVAACPNAVSNTITIANGVTASGADDHVCNLGSGESLIVEQGGSVDLQQDALVSGINSKLSAVFVADGTSAGAITNNGTITADDTGDLKGIYIAGTATGQITNAGTVEADGSEVGIALDISGAVPQGVTNTGSLNGTRYGMRVYNSGISGATVQLVGGVYNTVSGVISGGETGVILDGLADSFTNDGLIEGGDEHGLLVSGVLDSIINQGVGEIRSNFSGASILSANISDFKNLGENSLIVGDRTGVSIGANSTIQQFLNEGTIRGQSSGLAFIGFGSPSVVTSFKNQGLIESTDSDGVGIIIDGAEGGGSVVSDIVNTGSVNGGTDDGRGIYLTETVLDGSINNSATVSGGQYAIFVDSDADIDGNDTDIENSGLLDGAVELEGTSLLLSGDNPRVTGDVQGNDDSIVHVSGQFATEAEFEVGHLEVLDTGSMTLNHQVTTSASEGFVNGGQLVLPANASANIVGDYVQSIDGVLKTEANSGGHLGRLVVDGTASLASDAKIELDLQALEQPLTEAQMQDIISATSLVSDNTFTVSDNSLLFDFSAEKDGNTVDLAVSDVPATGALGSGPFSQGVDTEFNRRGSGAATVLDAVFSGDPSSDLALAFARVADNKALSHAVSESMPLLTGDLALALQSVDHRASGLARDELVGRPGHFPSCQCAHKLRAWAQPYKWQLKQQADTGISGYRASSSGLQIGLGNQHLAHREHVFALGVTLDKTDIQTDDKSFDQSADADTQQLFALGEWKLSERNEFYYQAAWSRSEITGKRNLPFANAVADSQFDAQTLQLSLGLGRQFKRKESSNFQLISWLNYQSTRTDAYTESGAGALNLDVDKSSNSKLQLAVELGYIRQLNARTRLDAKLHLAAAPGHEATTVSAFAGGGESFETKGSEDDGVTSGLSLTLSYKPSAQWRYHASVAGNSRSGYSDYGVDLGVSWDFTP